MAAERRRYQQWRQASSPVTGSRSAVREVCWERRAPDAAQPSLAATAFTDLIRKGEFSAPSPTHRASRGPPCPFRGGIPASRSANTGDAERASHACHVERQGFERTPAMPVRKKGVEGIPPRNGEGGPCEAWWVGLRDCKVLFPLRQNRESPSPLKRGGQEGVAGS